LLTPLTGMLWLHLTADHPLASTALGGMSGAKGTAGQATMEEVCGDADKRRLLAASRRLRSPFARRNGELPLLKTFKGAILDRHRLH
jgi:hypothetical protein